MYNAMMNFGLVFFILWISELFFANGASVAYTYLVYIVALWSTCLFFLYFVCCWPCCCLKPESGTWRDTLIDKIMFFNLKFSMQITFLLMLAVQILFLIINPLFFW